MCLRGLTCSCAFVPFLRTCLNFLRAIRSPIFLRVLRPLFFYVLYVPSFLFGALCALRAPIFLHALRVFIFYVYDVPLLFYVLPIFGVPNVPSLFYKIWNNLTAAQPQ